MTKRERKYHEAKSVALRKFPIAGHRINGALIVSRKYSHRAVILTMRPAHNLFTVDYQPPQKGQLN